MGNLFHTETRATDSQKVFQQSHSNLPSKTTLDDAPDDNGRGPPQVWWRRKNSGPPDWHQDTVPGP